MTKDDGRLPLIETKEAKGRSAHKLYFASMVAGLCLILTYRWIHIPAATEETKIMRWACYGMLGAELWFAFYWILSQISRWRLVYRYTFIDRLLQRYQEELPHVDIFVCTADPVLEPPLLVINTVLSVMAYDYPTEKLSVYLSDDGGSELTFYALLQAIEFAKHWIPFCKIYNVMPRSPAAYFSVTSALASTSKGKSDHFAMIKELYKEMEERIETVVKLGRVPANIRETHRGFREWNSNISRHDHQTILEILVDDEDPKSLDGERRRLPTVVYLAREKRPHHPHNFKAGAMNALIRVSSEISNGPIILNVDCDMYSNNPESVKDAVCFFIDEEAGNEIAYVQFPQKFCNVTRNDPYHSSLIQISEVEFPGADGFRGPLYIGTGCFHRRESLCGKIYSRDFRADWTRNFRRKKEESLRELEERAKSLANCAFERNTQWGKEMGLKYGCLVEDVITGLSIQCRGWRSVYFSPSREGFVGVAPTTLLQSLVQHKRWAEGQLQIFFAHNPLVHGFRKIPLAHQLQYIHYNLWALNSLSLLYYFVVPSLFLLKEVSLFPKVSSPWFMPFAYVVIANYTYSLFESIFSGATLKGWWNFVRMTFWRRTSSYVFTLIDTISRLLGISNSVFIVTAKTMEDEGVAKRYEQEIMEFGSSSPMLTMLATLALLNLLSLVGALTRVAVMRKEQVSFDSLALQFILCGSMVIINLPIYEALFFRKDMGKLPLSVTLSSIALAALVCLVFSQ